MYNNLKLIGLTKYLNKCCGSKNWVREGWLVALGIFVGTLTEENKNILISKIRKGLEHYQINDIVNEVMIACAFHSRANFMGENDQKSCDLFEVDSNLKIEVKTLNEGDDEKERHKQNKFLCISKRLSDAETLNEKQDTKIIIYKKCNDHLEKAATQIDNKGEIYLIYDYNLLSSKNAGSKEEPLYTQTHRSATPEEEVKNIIKNCVNEFTKNRPEISIEVIYFGDLRNKVANLK